MATEHLLGELEGLKSIVHDVDLDVEGPVRHLEGPLTYLERGSRGKMGRSDHLRGVRERHLPP